MTRKSHGGGAHSSGAGLTGSAIVPDAAQKAAPRETTKAEGYFSVYANDIQMQITPWDMRLTFGELEVVTKNEPTMGATPFVAVKVLGDIRISLQLTKALVKIMIDQIQQYEERFGQI